MSGQVVLLLESFIAMDTGKRLIQLARLVRSEVLVEFLCNLEQSGAVWALHAAQLLDVVAPLVELQLVLGQADLPAPLAVEVPGAVLAVLLYVTLQLGAGFVPITAN